MSTYSASSPGASHVMGSVLGSLGLMKGNIGGTGVIVPSNSGSMLNGNVYEQTVTLTTSNSISPVFGSSQQQIDIQIAGAGTSNQIDVYNQMFLEFTVNNDDGVNALRLPPAWYAIGLLQLLINGNSVSQFQYPMNLEQSYICRATIHEHERLYAQLGYPDGVFTNTGITIAAGGSRTFLIPLHHVWPELMKLPIKAIVDNVTVRSYWNPGSGYYFSTSASTSISCSQLRIIASGQQLSGPASAELQANAMSSVTKLPCIIPQNRSINVGALTASASAPSVLNMQGALVQLRALLYDSNITTPESKLNTETFLNWQYLNATGAIVNLGSYWQYENMAWTATHYGKAMRVLPASVGAGDSAAEVLKYVDKGPSIIFCKDVPRVMTNESRHGGYSCSGAESFSVTATLTNGVALIFFDILGWATLSNGHLTYTYQSR